MFLFRQSGLKQAERTTLRDGLARELSALPKNFVWNDPPANARMDAYIANK